MTIRIDDPSEYELKDMLWGGAQDTLDEIVKADKFDAFCQYIDDIYGDEGVGLTQLNDILRFESDEIKKDIGMKDWDGLRDLINDKAIKKAQKVISEIEDEWEEYKDSEDNKDEKGNPIYDNIEDWVNDEYSYEPYSLVCSAVDMIEGEVDRIADDEEKSDDWDSMVEAITMCALEEEFKDFDDIVDMVRELDSWISDNM